MKKLSLVVVSSLLAIALLVGTLVGNQTNVAHAATINNNIQKVSISGLITKQPAWIVEADPYVHVISGKAVINPAISKVLSPNDVVKVEQSVQHYNSLSTSVKAHPLVATPHLGCNPGGTYYYWWGDETVVTSCGVALLTAGLALAALFPAVTIAAGITIAAIQIMSALSCNGWIYVDYSWVGGEVMRPYC